MSEESVYEPAADSLSACLEGYSRDCEGSWQKEDYHDFMFRAARVYIKHLAFFLKPDAKISREKTGAIVDIICTRYRDVKASAANPFSPMETLTLATYINTCL